VVAVVAPTPTPAPQPVAAVVADPVRVPPPPAPAPEMKTVSLVPAVRDTPVQLPMLLEEELFQAAPETASVEPTLQLRLLDDDEQPPMAAAG
jgi:hypothetical protein